MPADSSGSPRGPRLKGQEKRIIKIPHLANKREFFTLLNKRDSRSQNKRDLKIFPNKRDLNKKGWFTNDEPSFFIFLFFNYLLFTAFMITSMWLPLFKTFFRKLLTCGASTALMVLL